MQRARNTAGDCITLGLSNERKGQVMCELTRQLKALKRPAILIRAARFGVPEYSRQRDLRRLTRVAVPKSPRRSIPMLMDLERKVEHRRITGDANYSLARHVDLLIALMGEARAL